MTMVEKVARAMATDFWGDDGKWKIYEKAAKAAIVELSKSGAIIPNLATPLKE